MLGKTGRDYTEFSVMLCKTGHDYTEFSVMLCKTGHDYTEFSVMLCKTGHDYTEFSDSAAGEKQDCLLSPNFFGLFISEVADESRKAGRRGILLSSLTEEIVSLSICSRCSP